MASPLGQQSFTQTTTTVGSFPNPGQRLSPQSQFNAQLSPRQAYPQVSTQNTTWQQQAQVRLTMQQNPMLTAQLTVSLLLIFVTDIHSTAPEYITAFILHSITQFHFSIFFESMRTYLYF